MPALMGKFSPEAKVPLFTVILYLILTRKIFLILRWWFLNEDTKYIIKERYIAQHSHMLASPKSRNGVIYKEEYKSLLFLFY